MLHVCTVSLSLYCSPVSHTTKRTLCCMFALFHCHCTAVQYHILRNELCVACLHSFTVTVLPSSITYYETNFVLHVCTVSLSLYRRPLSHTTKLCCTSALFHCHCIAVHYHILLNYVAHLHCFTVTVSPISCTVCMWWVYAYRWDVQQWQQWCTRPDCKTRKLLIQLIWI